MRFNRGNFMSLFKPQPSPPPPQPDWAKIARDAEAAKVAKQNNYRLALEAKARSDQLALQARAEIAATNQRQGAAAAVAATAAAKAQEERVKKQKEADDLRKKLELEAQIARLKTELDGYRGTENNYQQKVSQYNALTDQYNKVKSDYEKNLLLYDDLKVNINTADKDSIIATEDKKSVYALLTQQYIDTTKKPQDIYNEILDQNRILDEKITNLKNSFTTDDQKVVYEDKQLEYMSNVSFILFIFYYVMTFILAIILFVYNRNDNKSIIWKGVILILFLIYPFAINIVEAALYTLMQFSYKVINGDAYVK